jgi:hypothetical protein
MRRIDEPNRFVHFHKITAAAPQQQQQVSTQALLLHRTNASRYSPCVADKVEVFALFVNGQLFWGVVLRVLCAQRKTIEPGFDAPRAHSSASTPLAPFGLACVFAAAAAKRGMQQPKKHTRFLIK